MMHGRGKSDLAIVAAKPANKVEQSTAEPVEPRAGAKGNASQHSTDRAQSRGTVSQAHTASSKGKEDGEVHRAAPPHQLRTAGGSIRRSQAGCSRRRRRVDVRDL